MESVLHISLWPGSSHDVMSIAWTCVNLVAISDGLTGQIQTFKTQAERKMNLSCCLATYP